SGSEGRLRWECEVRGLRRRRGDERRAFRARRRARLLACVEQLSMSGQGPSSLTLYVRLLREARPYWPLIGVLFLLSLLVTPILLLLPLPLKIAIDSILGAEPVPAALQMLLPKELLASPGGLLVLMSVALLAIAVIDQLQRLAISVLGVYTGEK